MNMSHYDLQFNLQIIKTASTWMETYQRILHGPPPRFHLQKNS
jgi:hypothetical protein